MKHYFDWHRIQTARVTSTNWWQTTTTTNTNPRRYLIVRCLKHDRCGGLSTRLKPLLVFVAMAAHTQRILYIRWEHPYPLEYFLLPQAINWTVPDYIQQELQRYDRVIQPGKSQQPKQGMLVSRAYFVGPSFLQNHLRASVNTTIVETGLQLSDGGARLYQCVVDTMRSERAIAAITARAGVVPSEQYANNRMNNTSTNKTIRRTYAHCNGKINGESNTLNTYYSKAGKEAYQSIYHDVFYTFFQPSEPVPKMVDTKLKSPAPSKSLSSSSSSVLLTAEQQRYIEQYDAITPDKKENERKKKKDKKK